MSLGIAEQRIAARDLSGMLRCGSAPFFTGELQAAAYTSVLANQPKAGTTGFYILGTLVIVR